MKAAKLATILVVEDQPLVRRMAVEALEELGYEVLEAKSAAEALCLLQFREIDVLFTDLALPGGMDGIRLAHRIAALVSDVGVVVTSGGAMVRPSSGVEHWQWLPKPYRPGQLGEAIAVAAATVSARVS